MLRTSRATCSTVVAGTHTLVAAAADDSIGVVTHAAVAILDAVALASAASGTRFATHGLFMLTAFTHVARFLIAVVAALRRTAAVVTATITTRHDFLRLGPATIARSAPLVHAAVFMSNGWGRHELQPAN
jgi:hypothetical protein